MREMIFRIVAAIFSTALGLNALYGGYKFIKDPSGGLLHIIPEPMQKTYSIQTFLVPGIVLFTQYGICPIFGLILTFASEKTRKYGYYFQIFSGVSIYIWILVQVKAYGLILPMMQFGVLVLGTGITVFSSLALKEISKFKTD